MLCQHMAVLTECIQFPDLLLVICRRSGVWKLACILFYFNNGKYSYYQFCNWHGKPDRVCSCDSGKQINETSADHCASCHWYKERSAWFHQRLEIVGRKNVKRQQEKADGITADDSRSNRKYFVCRSHKNADEEVGSKFGKRCPDQTKYGSRSQCVF